MEMGILLDPDVVVDEGFVVSQKVGVDMEIVPGDLKNFGAVGVAPMAES